MGGNRRWTVWLLAAVVSVGTTEAWAQKRKPTVRKHRVAEENVHPATLEAETALAKRDLLAAEQLLQKATIESPNDYRAWFNLGYVLSETDREPQAIEAYRKAVAAKPDVFESNLNLGVLLARAGQNDEAEKYLLAASTLKPSASADEALYRVWVTMGRVREQANPAGAVEAYEKAAALKPNNAEPVFSAGSVLERMQDFPAAEARYRRALELNPKSSDALAGLANVYMAQKKLPDAEQALRQYLAADPKNAAAHLQLARVLRAQGKHDEAAAELAQAGEAAPNDFDLRRERAAAYAASRDFERAATEYQALVKERPQEAELRYQYGVVLQKLQRYPESQAEIMAALKLNAKIPEAYGDLAVVAAANKNFQLAILALDERSKYLPESPATHFLRATSYDHLHAYEQASQSYKQFLAMANGCCSDQEWQARHRLKAIDPKSK